MAKATNGTKRANNRKSKTEKDPSDTIAPFDIDHNPPIFARPGSHEAALFRARLEKTIPDWKIGSAIAIDSKKKHTAINYLRTHYPHERWAVNKILGNNDKVRLYRLAQK